MSSNQQRRARRRREQRQRSIHGYGLRVEETAAQARRRELGRGALMCLGIALLAFALVGLGAVLR